MIYAVLIASDGRCQASRRSREGLSPRIFSQVDPATGIPANSASLGLLLTALWLLYFVGGQFFGWFGAYAFDSSELPIITIYPMYLPILLLFMKKEKELSAPRRFVLPCLSIVGIGIMVAASIYRHGISILWYLTVFSLIMLLGAAVYLIGRRAHR